MRTIRTALFAALLACSAIAAVAPSTALACPGADAASADDGE